MTDDIAEQLRDKDQAVLTCIHEGHDTTRAIREKTTLSNRDVNYALDKLETLGFIETETPDGRITEIVDGQKRNFKAPREARITDTGREHLSRTEQSHTKYREMTHDELVERVQEIEQELEDVQNALDAFRQQVLKKLD